MTVAGEAEEVTLGDEAPRAFAERRFKLDEEAPFGAGIDNDILVIAAENATLANVDEFGISGCQNIGDQRVVVQGTVAAVDVALLEEQFGEETLEDNAFANRWAGRTAIIANWVEIVELAASEAE